MGSVTWLQELTEDNLQLFPHRVLSIKDWIAGVIIGFELPPPWLEGAIRNNLISQQAELHPSLREPRVLLVDMSGHSSDDEDANAQLNGEDGEDGAGLFGSGSEDEGTGEARKLSDEDLDSGDDQGRNDRAEDNQSETKEATHTREENVIDVSIGRHSIPQPSDGEIHLLQFPSYLGIEPKAFTPSDWKPPTSEHHTNETPSSNFSAYQTSNNTIRWRHAPNDPGQIQSNARVIRWSDGSLTVQVASNAKEQFALSAKALAPPQINPPKPTPTSLSGKQAEGKVPYNPRLDSHTYLASFHESSSILQITNHVTSSLAVQSYADEDDDALIKLQESLAGATKNHKGVEGVEIMHITEDPELAKKKAEVAQKEVQKAARRRQLQEEKERDRSNRVLGRSGLRTGGYGGGLTIGGLEDDEGMARPRARPGKPKAKKPRRRNSEYSDEEEFTNRGRTREDEYDEDDGFLVGSDEEPELVEDESPEEEDIDMDEERPGKKSSRKDAAVEEEAPAAAGSPRGRTKRRRVIDDEDEDE